MDEQILSDLYYELQKEVSEKKKEELRDRIVEIEEQRRKREEQDHASLVW